MIRMDDSRVRLNGSTEDIRAVKELFASLCFEAQHEVFVSDRSPLGLTVKRFSNWYKDSTGKAPLYCVVPDRTITCVWPPRDAPVSEVKYGTASNQHGNICSGLVVHLENRVGLYFCLSPAGSVIEDDNSLGI
jgi:hypothetical protein